MLPEDDVSLDLFVELLGAIGGIPLGPGESTLWPYLLFGALVRCPVLALRLAARLARLLISGQIPLSLVVECLVKGAYLGNAYMHNFMNTDQVAAAGADPTTRLRLEGCLQRRCSRERYMGNECPKQKRGE